MIMKLGSLTITLFWMMGCNQVTVIYPEKKDIIETVYASGKIVSGNEYKLAALSNGTILKKLVRDGDSVKKGQLLFVVNNEAANERYQAALTNYRNIAANLSEQSPLLKDLKLALQNAALRCSNDSITYYRYKNLFAQDIGTRSNLENIYTTYQVSLNQQKIAEQKYHSALNDLEVSYSNARSQLTAAGKELKEYFIRSDHDGVVYQTFKESGETVYTNEVVALMGDQGDLVIRLAVDQQDINRIKTGQQVLLQTDVTGNTTYEATISYIFPVMNEQDQTFRVDALFAKKPPPTFIHSSVEANIIIQKKTKALVLPRNALAGNDSVWVQLKKNRKKIGIQTGIATLEHVEVTAGLNERTPVVLNTENNEP